MTLIRMLQTQPGSPDGVQVFEYQEGKEYDVPERLAAAFLQPHANGEPAAEVLDGCEPAPLESDPSADPGPAPAPSLSDPADEDADTEEPVEDAPAEPAEEQESPAEEAEAAEEASDAPQEPAEQPEAKPKRRKISAPRRRKKA